MAHQICTSLQFSHSLVINIVRV